jgi:hypothetical protein
VGKRDRDLGRRPVSAATRGGRRSAPALLGVLAVVGCAVSGSAEAAAPLPSLSWTGPSDPIALVGMWKLTGLGAETGTVVGLTPGELTIYRSCGELDAFWSAILRACSPATS